MNLREILEGIIDDRLKKTSAQKIGFGREARAYSFDHPKRQGEIYKVGKPRRPDVLSGNEIYIQEIYKLQQAGNNNPYFPRILSFKSFKDADGRARFSSRMEKLTPFQTPSIINNADVMKQVVSNILKDPEQYHFDPYTVVDLFDGSVAPYKDPNIIAAYHTINEIMKRNPGTRKDMAYENVMWRLGGELPQIVITDPLSN